MSRFTDEQLAFDIGLLEEMGDARTLGLAEGNVLAETFGASRFDVVMTYYQAMKTSLLSRRKLEIQIANGASPEEAREAFSEMWQNTNELAAKLPGYVDETVVRGLVFGVDKESRLIEPLEVAAFQLIAEKKRRDAGGGQSMVTQRIASVSGALGEAFTEKHRAVFGEESSSQLAALWSSKTTSELFGSPASELSDEELQHALSEIAETEKDVINRAYGLYQTLNSEMKQYDSLDAVLRQFPEGGEAQALTGDISGTVTRRTKLEDGEEKTVLEKSQAFEAALANYNRMMNLVESHLREDLGADPSQVGNYLSGYYQLNSAYGQLAAQAQANIMMFRENYAVIAPQLRGDENTSGSAEEAEEK